MLQIGGLEMKPTDPFHSRLARFVAALIVGIGVMTAASCGREESHFVPPPPPRDLEAFKEIARQKRAGMTQDGPAPGTSFKFGDLSPSQ